MGVEEFATGFNDLLVDFLVVGKSGNGDVTGNTTPRVADEDYDDKKGQGQGQGQQREDRVGDEVLVHCGGHRVLGRNQSHRIGSVICTRQSQR